MGFFQGDISLLMDDIKTLKPTLFPVVPRILTRIYDKVSEALSFLASVKAAANEMLISKVFPPRSWAL